LVEYLKKNPAYSIEIRGHTDSDGDDASNMELSQQRAKAVALYLESNGISPDRIKYKGYGETMPIVPNTSKENMLRNRRVEFVLRTKQ
jgi:outer membrane protein OmpA-like peptidoglycan-associated protein